MEDEKAAATKQLEDERAAASAKLEEERVAASKRLDEERMAAFEKMAAATKRLEDERMATAAIAHLHAGVDVALEKAERSHKKETARLAEKLRSVAKLWLQI